MAMLTETASQESDDLSGTEDSSVRGQRSPRAVRWNAAMKLIRRIHLYAGLFMFPWVMLYGVTAYLFNHPRSFTDQMVRDFGPAEVIGTPLANLPQPKVLAAEIVAAMAAAGKERQLATDIRLIAPDEARFARSQAQVAALGKEGRMTVSVNLADGAGNIRTRPAEAAPAPAPFADKGIQAKTTLADDLRMGVSEVLVRTGVEDAQLQAVTLPELLFQVEADGKPWQVAYNLDKGSLIAKPVGEPLQNLPTRNFLTKLHMVHRYSDAWDAKWFWALAVDGMFVSMVFWGASGILMRWQIKSTRTWGAVFLVASAIVATVMTIGMHREMLAAPPRAEAAPIAKPPASKSGDKQPESPSGPSARTDQG